MMHSNLSRALLVLSVLAAHPAHAQSPVVLDETAYVLIETETIGGYANETLRMYFLEGNAKASRSRCEAVKRIIDRDQQARLPEIRKRLEKVGEFKGERVCLPILEAGGFVK
jgi:hypothetical protein